MIKIKLSEFPVLHTKRLYLRALTHTDVQAVLFMRSDPEVNKYVKREVPKDIATIETFIAARNQDFERRIALYWAIEDRQTRTYLGAICLWHFSDDGTRAEVGYDLHPQAQGKGIMSEAMKTVLHYGFNTLALKEIEAFTHRDNAPSIGLLKRHHFVLQPERKDPGFETNVIFTLAPS